MAGNDGRVVGVLSSVTGVDVLNTLKSLQIDLCFNAVQAGALAEEHLAELSAKHYEFRMTRRGLLLDLGDIVTIDYPGIASDAGFRVLDMSIDESLLVTVHVQDLGITITVTLPNAVAPAASINAVADGNEGTTVQLGASLAGGTYDEIDYAWSVEGGTLDDAAIAPPRRGRARLSQPIQTTTST